MLAYHADLKPRNQPTCYLAFSALTEHGILNDLSYQLNLLNRKEKLQYLQGWNFAFVFTLGVVTF